MTERLSTAAALARAVERLCDREPSFGRLRAVGIEPALRRREGGFAGLASVVVGQQVSVASAAAINGRLRALLTDVTAAAVAATSDEALRAVGLSRAKLVTMRAMAAAVEAGRLDFDRIGDAPADEAVAALTAVPGIGPWTASVYCLFCLGHPDVLPAGDLAIQEAARVVFGLDRRPDGRTMAALAERWRPERGAAAYMLWAVYRARTGRDVAAVATSGRPPDDPQRNRDATPP